MYSPDLNPIEDYFGELKNYTRSRAHSDWEIIKYNFKRFLQECVRIVSSRKRSARGHFENAFIAIKEP